MTGNSDARHFSRLAFPSSSTLALGDVTQPCHLVDISLRGALVEAPEGATALDTSAGSRVVLQVQVEDSPVHFEMTGEVVWAEGRRLGIHCISIDVESITHLRRLLELNLGDPGLLDRELLEMA